MLARVYSAALNGIDGYPVTVEVDFRSGLPAFSIVGLPDAAVRESRERVIAAIKNSDLSFPLQRITVNLAPAHIRKEGPSFDFAIAIGILAAAGVVPQETWQDHAFLGELSLDGTLRPGTGVLPCALGLLRSSIKAMFLPCENAAEAALVEEMQVMPIRTLLDAVRVLNGESPFVALQVDRKAIFHRSREYTVDFAEVKGQSFAKRALEIAAAGNHNLLMIGPPGSGKTLLATRLPTILPDMEFDEALETTKIHSVAGYLREGRDLLATRPFRNPHHQISDVALVGGGSQPRPGEVSLAHRGVLFLDEFTEFPRHVLEGLRQPLEERSVNVVRIANGPSGESSDLIRGRVLQARARQQKRFEEIGLRHNSHMSGRHIRQFCALDPTVRTLLKNAVRRLGLSARAYDKVLKVARTIADLAGDLDITSGNIAEAIGYRLLDRSQDRS